MERITLEVDLSKLVKQLPKVNMLAEYEPRDIKEVWGIKQIKINIKNKDHRSVLDRYLITNLELDFKRAGKRFKAYLRKENKQFFLSEVNFYEEKEKSQISLYNGHKRRLYTGLVDVAIIEKKYLLRAEILRQLPDSEYFIVFRKGFYRCKKAGENLYFSYREKIKT